MGSNLIAVTQKTFFLPHNVTNNNVLASVLIRSPFFLFVVKYDFGIQNMQLLTKKIESSLQ